MPYKTRRKYEKGSETRRLARIVIGAPPSTKAIPDKRKKPAKHKKEWLQDWETPQAGGTNGI